MSLTKSYLIAVQVKFPFYFWGFCKSPSNFAKQKQGWSKENSAIGCVVRTVYFGFPMTESGKLPNILKCKNIREAAKNVLF